MSSAPPCGGCPWVPHVIGTRRFWHLAAEDVRPVRAQGASVTMKDEVVFDATPDHKLLNTQHASI